MDAATKRRTAEQVRRVLTGLLAPRGFVRGKPTFWGRPRGQVIEFVHLHLFTFGPSFRAHAGVRELNDPFEAVALNGPTSEDAPPGERRRFMLAFQADDAAIARCAAELARFCAEVAEPWFVQQAGMQAPPGTADPANVRKSRQLLGLP